MNRMATCVVDSANLLGECPVWCPRGKLLWWIDVARPCLRNFRPATGDSGSWPLPRPAGAIALREGGGLLIAFRRGFATCEVAGGDLVALRTSEADLGDARFNDGKVDCAGRFWAGTMDRKLARPVGKLYRLDGDGRIDTQDRGFVVGNGMGWSPDNRTMYFTDTDAGCIYRYDFDAAAGRVSGRRSFVQVDAGPSHLDGLAVDGDGCVWTVLFGCSRIDKYSPEGRLVRSLHLPVKQPTACTFGGDDLKTLYVTTARMGMTDAEIAATPGAGGLWAIELDRPGQAESWFRPAPRSASNMTVHGSASPNRL